jgi:S1-C subfamily serine protease
MYSQGQGVPRDSAEAAKWYTQAAELGLAEAQYALAALYSTGDGVPLDPSEAVKWYSKAAEQGNALAQYALAICYSTGNGVPKDAKEAATWYAKAAEQGRAEAQFRLAAMYAVGEDVPKDTARAVGLYTKAAEQGHTKAQAVLASIYAEGDGVPKSSVLAYFWSNLAAANGDEQSRKRRDALDKTMTREQIAEAQRMSAGFTSRARRSTQDPPVTNQPEVETADAFGSGFFVTTDGYFVTNRHVIEEASRIRIRTATGVYAATVVRQDPNNDLAVLKVQGAFSALYVRGSTGVRTADHVATVGFPIPVLQGLAPKYTSGEISALTGLGDDPGAFQISVPVQPGNSGGPLVDTGGCVVGVVVARLNEALTRKVTGGQRPENVNYAVKGTLLKSLFESVPGLQEKLVPAPTGAERDAAEVAKAVEAATGMVMVNR